MRRLIVSTRHWRSIVSLLAALTVVASACGSASSETTAGPSAPDSQNVATPAADAPEVAAADTDAGDDTDAASDTDAAVDADADTEADAPADTPSEPAAPALVSVEDAAAAAEVNIDLVQSNDDVRLVEVIDVDSGSITNLAAAVTGDRPVLLWFWAPH